MRGDFNNHTLKIPSRPCNHPPRVKTDISAIMSLSTAALCKDEFKLCYFSIASETLSGKGTL